MLELLERQHPLFLDRNIGNKKLAGWLQSAGIPHECHSDHFPREEADHIWIPECARRGWVIVTGDKRIETDPVNREAVVQSKGRMFLLEEGSSRAISWAAALIVSRVHLYEIVRDNEGPFFATVSRETGRLISAVRKP